MKWIKTYEDYNTKYDDASYNPFYYYSDGSDGNRTGEIISKPKVRETITKYNNVFKYVGICFSMPILSTDGLYIKVSVDLINIKPPGDPHSFRTIFYNALYYKASEQENVMSSAYPIIKGMKDLHNITFDFSNHQDGTGASSTRSFKKSNGRDVEQIKFFLNRALTNEENFMDKIMTELIDYLKEYLTPAVVINMVGTKKEEMMARFVKNTIIRCLSNWKNLTTDIIGKIAFEEISNSEDSHQIFNYIKQRQHIDKSVNKQIYGKEPDIDWYSMFQQQDKEGLDKSSDMVGMGFAD